MIQFQQIREYAQHLGIDDVKLTTTDPLTKEIQRFHEQQQAGLFTNRRHRHFSDIEKFYNVCSTLENARSVITACACYLTNEQEDLSKPGAPHGRIARYTWRNYYKDLRIRLTKLAEYIQSFSPHAYVVFSNGPVAEKPLAQRSGLGFYGKHSILIHPDFGSWIVLGEIITDLILKPEPPLATDCGDCRKCMDACPTHAIKEPYIIDRTRCIQELTNWCDLISEDIMDVWGTRLYGCTACQDICPMNQSISPRNPRTTIGHVGSSIPLFQILDTTEAAYRTQYADNQITASWINFKAIQRNALIALGHAGDTAALPYLEQFCGSANKILSHAAQWALSRIQHA